MVLLTNCVTSLCKVLTPIGCIEVIACQEGLHALNIVEPIVDIASHKAIAIRDIQMVKPDVNSDSQYPGRHFNQSVDWLRAYFSRDAKGLDASKPKLCTTVFNTDTFRSRVWCTLEEQVKYGQTITYGELAKLVGSPGASQAVGSAMRNNPVTLIVPCHRVTRAGGVAGNYAGGKLNSTKVWLLEHEKQ